MNTENNKKGEGLLNEEGQNEKRNYEKSDKPFTEGKHTDNSGDNSNGDREKKTQIEGERYGNNDNPDKKLNKEQYKEAENSAGKNPDEEYSDDNKEKGIAKDMNNREREAEKIQENEDTKNDEREIELNKEL